MKVTHSVSRMCPKLNFYKIDYLSIFVLQHLEQQQGALSQLVKVIKEDLDDLKCIEEGFAQT